MAYFPFFVDVKGQRCLVVGGGKVAYRKVRILLDYQPEIQLVSPEFCQELEQLEDRVTLRRRTFEDSDVDGANFVVVATEDKLTNWRVSDLCHEKRIPVNVVDLPEQCSFIFPALINENGITVGISTGGKSPTLAKYLKKVLREAMPACYEALVEDLGAYRELVKERVASLPARSAIFKEMADLGIAQGGRITREQVEDLINRRNGDGQDESSGPGGDEEKRPGSGPG